MNKLSKIIFLFALFSGLIQTTFSQEILYETYTERGKAAYSNGNFVEAEKLFKFALNEAEKLNNTELIASGSVNLGKLYHSQENFEKAEKLYLRATEIFNEIDGDDKERVAFALNNLGLLYTEQKKFDKAEEILRKTITIREKTLGENSSDVAITLLNLGKLYADQSKYTQANAVYVRSLQILVQYPELIDEILICLHNIAEASYQLKEYKRTESSYKLAIGIIEKNYGKYSSLLTEPLENYAIFLKKIKRNAEAIKIETRIKLLRRTK
ncbi:MAG: tetratricopeptide repeat protein [Acidobacteria bacterium]|nr:tetratricopeptide repeat protein [Acidobacteriota bacterium]